MNVEHVARNLAAIRDRIASACREGGRAPSEVRLIAVSKLQPEPLVQAAVDAGQRDFGENHVQALAARQAHVRGDAIWHLIGHIQTNKARAAVAADWIHTVDSPRIAAALARAAAGASPHRVLIQINIAAEPTKSGILPDRAEALIESVRSLSALDLHGLMCIPEIGEGRRWFAAMRELRDRLRVTTGLALPELSMGMSADFEDAVREGSTMVRVGTAIFGERGG